MPIPELRPFELRVKLADAQGLQLGRGGFVRLVTTLRSKEDPEGNDFASNVTPWQQLPEDEAPIWRAREAVFTIAPERCTQLEFLKTAHLHIELEQRGHTWPEKPSDKVQVEKSKVNTGSASSKMSAPQGELQTSPRQSGGFVGALKGKNIVGALKGATETLIDRTEAFIDKAEARTQKLVDRLDHAVPTAEQRAAEQRQEIRDSESIGVLRLPVGKRLILAYNGSKMSEAEDADVWHSLMNRAEPGKSKGTLMVNVLAAQTPSEEVDGEAQESQASSASSASTLEPTPSKQASGDVETREETKPEVQDPQPIQESERRDSSPGPSSDPADDAKVKEDASSTSGSSTAAGYSSTAAPVDVERLIDEDTVKSARTSSRAQAATTSVAPKRRTPAPWFKGNVNIFTINNYESENVDEDDAPALEKVGNKVRQFGNGFLRQFEQLKTIGAVEAEQKFRTAEAMMQALDPVVNQQRRGVQQRHEILCVLNGIEQPFLEVVIKLTKAAKSIRSFGQNHARPGPKEMSGFFREAAVFLDGAVRPEQLEAQLSSLEQASHDFRSLSVEPEDVEESGVASDTACADLQVEIAVLLESVLMAAQQALAQYKKLLCRLQLLATEYAPVCQAVDPLTQQMMESLGNADEAVPARAAEWVLDFTRVVGGASQELSASVRHLEARVQNFQESTKEFRAALLKGALAS